MQPYLQRLKDYPVPAFRIPTPCNIKLAVFSLTIMSSPNSIPKIIYWFWALFAASKPKDQTSTEVIVNQIKECTRKNAFKSRRKVTSPRQKISVFIERALLFMANGTVHQ